MTELNPVQLEYAELLLESDPTTAKARASEMLDQGYSPIAFFDEVYVPAMAEIGDRFGRLDIFLPELVQAAENARAVSIDVVQPCLAADNGRTLTNRGRVLLASVRADMHDIGKNIVGLMLEINGFEVLDLGVDVDPQTIVSRARASSVDIIALSALMTTSMPYMKEVVDLLDGLGLRGNIAVIVGGAPLTPEYADQIGADAYGANADEGVKQCLRLVGRRS